MVSLRNAIKRFRERLGRSRPNALAEKESTDFLQAILENETKAQDVADAAKTDTGPSVILKPIIRPGPPEAGWFGGDPMLPRDVDWPEIDGVPLCFLAQIDLAKLPTDIWSGLGPREGFLIFFNHPDRCDAKVLHVKDNLTPRSANVPFPNYMLGHNPNAVASYPYFNKFPVTATQHAGQMPEPVGWIRGQSDKFPPPFGGETERLDLTKPQHHPFDSASLDSLIQLMSDAIDLGRKHCDSQLGKDLSEAVRHKLRVLQSEALETQNETQKAFDLAVRDVRRQPVDPENVAVFVTRTAQLPLTKLHWVRDSENEVVDIETSSVSVVEPDRIEALIYLSGLKEHLFDCFVKDPGKIPAHYQDRIEQICEFHAVHESGGMSHAPRGFIYTPHGRASSNEVLLELPSSRLTGWVWGDNRSIVFLIDRKALKREQFSDVIVTITN